MATGILTNADIDRTDLDFADRRPSLDYTLPTPAKVFAPEIRATGSFLTGFKLQLVPKSQVPALLGG
jgi:hypothetical protein